MSRPASVISITAAAAHRAGFGSVASRQLAGKRRELDLDHDGFAAWLSGRVGWAVMPGALARWEQGSIPPAEVLMACDGQMPPQGLLESVPEGFPAQALAGHWLTCYGFTHNGAIRYHADVSTVVAVSDRLITATNDSPEPRTEGRSAPFRNAIDAQLAGRHLIGTWRNGSDTRYFGTMQLAVLPGETVMDGWYLGVASDIAVSFARWKWVRLDAGTTPELTLRKPAELHTLVAERSPYDPPLAVDEIGEA
jgi:hypothetical protein